ncbi:MAG: DUF6460 domain-containing protein [Nitratireductor sp.]
MYQLVSTAIKILVASLATGLILQKLNLSAEEILLELGLTPERVMEIITNSITWAVPNIILGSIVILPVWLVVYLFRPPRS